MNLEIPKKQRAVQLIGPDELVLNKDKSVLPPEDYQVLCKIETVGLCFSDLKLLKQFTGHARKSEITSGIGEDVLKEVSSYVPCETPAVPGHEAVVRVVQVGEKVKDVKAGERFLVQTDYRWLPTANSNRTVSP